MSTSIEELAAEMREQGPRQFAAWNQAAFDSYVEVPLNTLTNALSWQDKDQPDLDSPANYLRLVYEGVGAGWLGTLEHKLPPPTFLAHCLSILIPNRLRTIDRANRGEVLRLVWNLGEGLAREPQWLNQYAITQTGWSTDLQQLDKHIAGVLAPVLSPLPIAEWNNRYNLHVLNLRDQFPAFVPGPMYLASPAILCIENRLNHLETVAILLHKSGQSKILGSVGRLPEHQESFTPPEIETTPDAIHINGHTVRARHISSPRQTLCVASGYLIVSADDSQRLWLVEAA